MSTIKKKLSEIFAVLSQRFSDKTSPIKQWFSRNLPILKQWFRNCLIGIDQLINCIFGGAPDETMSSRLCRYKDNPYGRPFYLAVNWIFKHVFRWPNHCEDSLEPEDRYKDEVLK